MTAVRWALVALSLALVVATFVQCAGRRLLFPAPPRPAADLPLDAQSQRIWLEAPGLRSEAMFLAARSPRAERAPLILYAHGNGELIDHWVDEFEPLRAAGASVLLVEYPGYGRSPGVPSEASVTAAMIAAYDWAASRPDVDPTRLVGYGRSLGGGAICALARQRGLAALVLESTFTSVRAVAAELFRLPGFLVRDRFDNLEAVRAFSGPILLLHGVHDRSISVEHARRLHAAAATAELHLLPCGHNDCPRPWALLEDFFERHALR